MYVFYFIKVVKLTHNTQIELFIYFIHNKFILISRLNHYVKSIAI